MKDNRGQALVEFIIILPILILIVSCIIDFGNIMYQKYMLANDLDTISDMYLSEDNKLLSYLNDIEATVSYDIDGSYTNIKLVKEVSVNTIILNNIIGKKISISANKTIYTGN